MALVSSLALGQRTVVVYKRTLGKPESRRLAQIAELLHDARQYGFKNQVLVGGDLNFDLTAEPQKSVLEQAKFANPFGPIGLPPISGSSVGKRAIDWIPIRGAANARSPEVNNRTSASDHFPLSLALQPQ